MADHEGFIKLNRNMLKWRWVTSPPTGWLFVILLMKANYKKMNFEGLTVEPGQVVTSYPSLVKSSGLSIQQCRSAIKRLKSTGEITVKLYPRYQVITIVNYNQYQEPTGRITVEQQASNRQATGKQHQEKEYKEGKEGKKGKNIRGRSAPVPLSGDPRRYPCGLSAKPDWMTDEEWDEAKLMTADDIPARYGGEYDSIIEFLHDKKVGKLK